MKKLTSSLAALGAVVLVAFIASACAVDNDRPTPTQEKTGTAIVPPKGETIPVLPPIGKNPIIVVPGEVQSVPVPRKLHLVAEKNLGVMWEALLGGSHKGFLLSTRTDGVRAAAVTAYSLEAKPLAASGFLSLTESRVTSIVGLLDGSFVVLSNRDIDGGGLGSFTTHVGVDGAFLSRATAPWYRSLKLIGKEVYGTRAVNYGTLGVNFQIGKFVDENLVHEADYWFDKERGLVYATELAFIGGKVGFAATTLGAKSRAFALYIQQDGKTLREHVISSWVPDKAFVEGGTTVEVWAIDIFVRDGKFAVHWWDSSRGPSAETEQKLTYVRPDGTIEYTYHIPGISSLVELDDGFAGISHVLQSDTTFNVNVVILRKDTSVVQTLSIGTDADRYTTQIVKAKDGYTLGVVWRKRVTNEHHLAVVDYR